MRSDLKSASGLGFLTKIYAESGNKSANNMVKINLKNLNRISTLWKKSENE